MSEKRTFTAAEAAAFLGVSLATWHSKWKAGSGRPTLEELRELGKERLEQVAETVNAWSSDAVVATDTNEARYVLATNVAAERLLYRSSSALFGLTLSELWRAVQVQPAGGRGTLVELSPRIVRPHQRLPLYLYSRRSTPPSPMLEPAEFTGEKLRLKRKLERELDRTVYTYECKDAEYPELGNTEPASSDSNERRPQRVTVHEIPFGKTLILHVLRATTPSQFILGEVASLQPLGLDASRRSFQRLAQRAAEYLTTHLCCECASIHMLPGRSMLSRSDDIDVPEGPEQRALYTVAAYGLPEVYLSGERFQVGGSNAGIAGLVFADGKTREIDLRRDEAQRKKVRRPNFDNLDENSRFKCFGNTVVASIGMRLDPDRETRVGVVRLINVLAPEGDDFAPSMDFSWVRPELEAVAQELGRAYASVAAAERRHLLELAVSDLSHRTSIGYIRRQVEGIRQVMDFEYIIVWQRDATSSGMTDLLYEGAADRRAALRDARIDGVKRAVLEENILEVPAGGKGSPLQNGLEVPIVGETPGKAWGVLGCYNHPLLAPQTGDAAQSHVQELRAMLGRIALLMSSKVRLTPP